VYRSRQILHAGAGLDGSGLESNDGCFVGGTKDSATSSISIFVSDSLLVLMDLDADKTSTSVN